MTSPMTCVFFSDVGNVDELAVTLVVEFFILVIFSNLDDKISCPALMISCTSVSISSMKPSPTTLLLMDIGEESEATLSCIRDAILSKSLTISSQSITKSSMTFIVSVKLSSILFWETFSSTTLSLIHDLFLPALLNLLEERPSITRLMEFAWFID